MTYSKVHNSHLLLDARVVASAEDARLTLGSVAKDQRNPLFREGFFADPPRRWEARLDNVCPSVVHDEATGLYQLWYFSFINQALAAQTPLAQRPAVIYRGSAHEEEGLLYAMSSDGLHWERPALGLIEFEGSTANNLVMRRRTHGIHAGGVFKDDREPDPARRYKCLFRNSRERRMAVAFSADGLRWSEPVLWPAHDAPGDTHNNALWVPELGRYVGFTRGWTEPPYSGVRTVLRTESDDFVNWSAPVEVLRGRDAHDQVYSMQVFRYRGLYLGLPAILHKGDREAPDWDTVTTELAWSPDTVTWHRVCPGQAFIPLGAGRYPTGAYDCGCIYSAAPIRVGDTLRVYYGGSNGLHNGWREGSFNLATLPLDRFAGYVPSQPDQPGRLTTRLVQAGAEALTVNVELQPGGSLRAAVLDDQGWPLPGHGLDDCQPITTGDLAAAVRWPGRPWNALAGRPIRLTFALTGAKLFAFSGCSILGSPNA
jgi:hypothetical protein